MLKIRSSISLIALGLLTAQLYAQVEQNIDSNSYNDQQIQLLVQEANKQGLTTDQIIQIAESKGATQEQINQLLKSINQTKENSEVSLEKKEIPSKTEKYSKKADIMISDQITKIFGHQLFNSKNLTFEPSVNIPIPNDYVLGVNDELTINVSGASQQIYQLKIDHNGCIFIPNIGPVYLLGINYEDACQIIKQRLTSIFYGMVGPHPSIWADVSISNLRSIKVNIIGEAMVPGTYTIPATASAFNALYLSGGPNENGSFRNIQVIRNNRTIKSIDVYEYLLNGENKSNIYLRDQDIIYVPTYETRVDVEGAFKRKGFYELKKGEPLDCLIRYAGGFTSLAFKSSLTVNRVTDSQRRIIDVDSKQYNSFIPENGDSITAAMVLDRYENRISISGAVFRPGSYSLIEGMKLSDLIKKAQGLREDAFSNRGLVIRLNEDLTKKSIAFVVSDVQSGKFDMQLQREDSVVIQDIFSMREKRFVRIYGEVQKEGEYPYNDQMTISDLILQSGGLNESASESYIEISRRHNYEDAAKMSDELVKLFQIKIERDLKLNDADKLFTLAPYDYVYVRKAPSYYVQKTVSIEGEVLYPGQYSIRSKNERISDLIKRAGGLTPSAYVFGATLYRNTENKKKDTTYLNNIREDTLMNKAIANVTNKRVEIHLSKIIQDTNSIYNYHLKEGDHILIPEISEEVHVAGAILNPIGLAYEPHRSAKYYIEHSGGFGNNANPKKVYVIYSNGTTKVAKSFMFTRYPIAQPGSTIMVPEKPEKQHIDSGKWLAIASTFSSIALAIVAVFR